MRLDPKPKPVRSIFHSGDYVYDSLESLRKHFDYDSVHGFFGGPFFKWVRHQDPVLAGQLERFPKDARKLEVIKLFFTPGADGVQDNLGLVVYWLQNGYEDNARNYLRYLMSGDQLEIVHQVGAGRFFSVVTGVPEDELTVFDLFASPEASGLLPDLINVAQWGDAVCSEILMKGTERLRMQENLSQSALLSLYELVLDYRVGARIRPEEYSEIAEVARFFATVVSIRQTLADGKKPERWKDELVNADRCAFDGGPIVQDFYTAFIVAVGRSMTPGSLEFLDDEDLYVLPEVASSKKLNAVLDSIRHPRLRMDCMERDDTPQALSQMLDDYCLNFLNWLQDV